MQAAWKAGWVGVLLLGNLGFLSSSESNGSKSESDISYPFFKKDVRVMREKRKVRDYEKDGGRKEEKKSPLDYNSESDQNCAGCVGGSFFHARHPPDCPTAPLMRMTF